MKREKACKLGQSVVLLFLILAISLWGCEKKEESVKATGAAGQMSSSEATGTEATLGEAPHIEFDALTFNFGKVDQGQDVSHAFKFRNTGDSELIIEKVQSSCGCTAALASSKNIGPGEEGEIRATFKTKGYQGRSTKAIRVQTNDPNVANITLRLTGEILTEVMVKPRSLNFGNLKRGTTTGREIDVTFSSDEEIQIKKIESTSEHFKTAVEPYESEAGRGAKITVSAKADIPLGRIKEKILVHTTSSKSPTLTVPIYVYVQGDITVSPMVLSFSKTSAGGVKERDLKVSTTAEAFAILDVEVKEDLFSAEVETVEQGKEYSIKVMLNEEASEGRIHEALLIHTDNKEQPEIRVPIYGSIGDAFTTKRRGMRGKDDLNMPAPRGIKPRLFKKSTGEEKEEAD